MSANGNKGFLLLLPFSSLALDASSTDNLHFRSTAIGSPPPSLSFSRWNLGPRHILLLNIIACTDPHSLFRASLVFLSTFGGSAPDLTAPSLVGEHQISSRSRAPPSISHRQLQIYISHECFVFG
ncbi:hypothetical protein KSP40_PGU018739 [Platanthera guangdongensis]|uniref:Secreted protein n=1 Tax=Platanthera guangdongensis TaxID=2320717 RepID=A0ABR2LRZ7_9ASPA